MPKSWQQTDTKSYSFLPVFPESQEKVTETDTAKEGIGEWLQTMQKFCYKNVIIFEKGVAFCKQVCYNTVTYIRVKE